MKKLFVLFCLLASFMACSDDKNDDPVMPITGLQMPTVNPVAGGEVTIAGKGFATDCKLQVQPEGAAVIDVEIVEVTNVGITFKIPTDVIGKCKVILLQGGKTYELGDLTIEEVPDVESSLYGVFVDETQVAVCPVDVVAQQRGKTLFTLEDEPEGIIADNHGVVYYKLVAFENNKLAYELYYYDVKAGKGGKINWDNAATCLSIGTDGEKLYALATTEDLDICLYTVNKDGNATLVQNYGNPIEESFIRLYSTGGTFLVGEELMYVGVRIDMGGEVYHASIVGYLDDNYADLYASQDLQKSYRYVKTNNDYYVFKNDNGEDAVVGATVQKFTSEEEWNDSNYSNPVVATIDNYFTDQVYDPTTGLIYGMFGEDGDGILSFDPKTNKVLEPWMGSGCVTLVYIKK